MKMSDRTPIEHLCLWRFEEREAQRERWDEEEEHRRDLEYESRRDDESWNLDDPPMSEEEGFPWK